MKWPITRTVAQGGALIALVVLALQSTTCDAAPEPWKFEFDGRAWQLGHEMEGEDALVRRYLVRGEDIYRWTEMLQSRVSRVYQVGQPVNANASASLHLLRQHCGSLDSTVIVEGRPRGMTIAWQAPSCQFHLPLQGILRVERIDVSGVPLDVELLYVVKSKKMSSDQQARWRQRIQAATPEKLAETLEAANAAIATAEESPLHEAQGQARLRQLSAEQLARAYLHSENLLRIISLAKAGVPTTLHGSGPPQKVTPSNADEVDAGVEKDKAALLAELARRGAARLAPAYTQVPEPNCNLPPAGVPSHPELTVRQKGNTLNINEKGSPDEEMVSGVVVGKIVAIAGGSGIIVGRLEGREIWLSGPSLLACSPVLRPIEPPGR